MRWWPTRWAAKCSVCIAAATAANAGRKSAAPISPPKARAAYNNTIAVHPEDPDTVVCGLNDIHITRDGGATWLRASHWDADEGTPEYVHADQHAIVLPGGNLIYAANDGGVAFSEDMGETWSTRVRGLVTTMFYDIDVAPANGRIFGGGAQDNGSLVTGVTGTEESSCACWMATARGWSSTRRTNPRLRLEIRHPHLPPHRGQHWSEDFWEEVSPKGLKGTSITRRRSRCWPSIRRIGARSGWARSACGDSTDDGREWEPVSPVFDGTAITAIEIPAGCAGAGVGGHASAAASSAAWTTARHGRAIFPGPRFPRA